MTCCDYGCTGAHGCAAHTEPSDCTALQPVATHDEPGLTVTEWHYKPEIQITPFGWILLVLSIVGFVITIYRSH